MARTLLMRRLMVEDNPHERIEALPRSLGRTDGSRGAASLSRTMSDAMRVLLEGLTRDLGDAEVLTGRVLRGIEGDGPPLLDAVRSARERVEQLQRVSRSLDLVARLGQSTPLVTDPACALSDAEAYLRASSVRTGGFACELSESPPVLADPARLIHVLAKLVALAVETVEESEPPRVRARISAKNDHVTFEITAKSGDGRAPPFPALAKLEVELCRQLAEHDDGLLTTRLRGSEIVLSVTFPALDDVLPSERPTSRPRLAVKLSGAPSAGSDNDRTGGNPDA